MDKDLDYLVEIDREWTLYSKAANKDILYTISSLADAAYAAGVIDYERLNVEKTLVIEGLRSK